MKADTPCTCGHTLVQHGGPSSCGVTGCPCNEFTPKTPMLDRDRFLERIAVALERIADTLAPVKIGDGETTSTLHETLLTQLSVIEDRIDDVAQEARDMSGKL